MKQSRLWFLLIIIENYVTLCNSCSQIVLHQNKKRVLYELGNRNFQTEHDQKNLLRYRVGTTDPWYKLWKRMTYGLQTLRRQILNIRMIQQRVIPAPNKNPGLQNRLILLVRFGRDQPIKCSDSAFFPIFRICPLMVGNLYIPLFWYIVYIPIVNIPALMSKRSVFLSSRAGIFTKVC